MPNRYLDERAPVPKGSSEEWARVGGVHVRFLRAGSGPAVVLVHGLLGYSFNWRRTIPQLAQGRQVFVPDMPGSGFSECTSKLDRRLSSSASRLNGFLDAVGIDSCDLVGSSYGGATAILTAVANPTRVRRLILVSPANPWSRIGRRRLMLLRIPPIAACFPTVARWARPMQGYFVRRMYGDPKRLTAETLASHFKPLERPGVLEHAVGIVKTWWADMAELKTALPRVSTIPTLLVWGSLDRTVDPASASPLSLNFESVRIAIVEGAGHLPYEECPEEFSKIVKSFLELDSAKG